MSLADDFPLNPAIDRATLTDGRARFFDVLNAVNMDHGAQLPDYKPSADILEGHGADEVSSVDLEQTFAGLHVVAVPGFLTECIAFLADCLTDGLAHLEALGARTSIAPLAGRGGCLENAKRLKDHLNLTHRDGERFILVAMSKGAADTMVMLQSFPETAKHIEAVVSLVGCVCGSPLAYYAPKWLKAIERHMPMPTCGRYDGDAVVDLDPKTRTDFLAGFMWPDGVKIYSLGVAVDETLLSKGMVPSFRVLTQHHPRTDGQMLLRDQVFPHAKVLGVLKCDHIASGMPFNRSKTILARMVVRFGLDQNAFPREVMMEAIVRQVLEDRDQA